MPTVIITPIRWSRSPIQSFFLFLLMVSGILIALNLSRNAITRDMGEPWASIWGGILAVGSAVALVGAYWPLKTTGMLIERSGVLLLGGGSLYWAFMIFKRNEFDSLFTELIVILFAIACFVQVRYINKHMNLILEAISKGGRISE